MANMAEGQSRWAIRWVLLASLWLSLLLLAMKIWIGWSTQSLSLLAEALHTLVSIFSLFLSIIAVSSHFMGGREGWGHSKLEAAIALIMVAFMGFACLSLLAIALHQLLATGLATKSLPTTASMLQFLGMVIATTFCLACFERYEAGVLTSTALHHAANRALQDTWLTLLVLGGLILSLRFYIWIDAVVTIAILGLVIVGCWQVLNRQLPLLINQVAIAPEAIAQTIHQVEGITHCYNIRSRGVVGRQILIEMRLILHPECTNLARTIAERVERALRERYGPTKVIIYVDQDVAIKQR
jgi:cation diffusion facilitator family transporter